MRERSKNMKSEVSGEEIAGGEYAPVRLADEFPVSMPHHVLRSKANAIKAHVHQCLEIGYCHEGNGIFLIGGKMLHCGPGDAIAIREGETHLLISPQDSSTRWSFVNLDPPALLAGALRDLSECDSSPLSSSRFVNVISKDRHADVCELVKALVEELDGALPGRRQAVMAMVWALLVKLRRMASAPSEDDAPEDAESRRRDFEAMDRLRPAIRHIADTFSKRMSIAGMAKLCRMSEPNFRRLFHRCFGLSPRDYVLRLRIEVAKSLLKNSAMPVLELSLRAGFPSLSNFNRQFKSFEGISPREYRKAARRTTRDARGTQTR